MWIESIYQVFQREVVFLAVDKMNALIEWLPNIESTVLFPASVLLESIYFSWIDDTHTTKYVSINVE